MVHLPYFGYRSDQHLDLQISPDTVNVAAYARDCYDKVKELKTKIESRRDGWANGPLRRLDRGGRRLGHAQAQRFRPI